MATTYAMLHKDIENLKPDFYVIPQKYDFYPLAFIDNNNKKVIGISITDFVFIKEL